MPGLGLHMIVKDEAHVIERCLRSVLPFVDWWVVSDTGSTDGTQDLVRRTMASVDGLLIERPWVSFGHNRQEALEAARTLEQSRPGDYVLWIDADEELVDLPAALPELTADGYHLEVEYGAARYQRLAVVRLDRPWRWVGALHEHLELPGARLDRLFAPRVVSRHEGARSRDPATFLKDAAVLEAELRRHPDDPRTQFYLAQSWRDAGDLEKAAAAYRVRIANEAGWSEERWYARFQLAVCLERLGRPHAEVAAAYLDAYAALPSRAEPLVELARLERLQQRLEVAVLYARTASRIPQPGPDSLFVDRDAYAWRALDELAVSCFWCGRFDEGRRAAEQALAVRPDDERLQANLGFFHDQAR
jgi:tetratricopeptide (TPR) repeat protein